MFPDSKIAKDFHSGRSKTTAVIKEMAAQQKSTLRERMRATPFTVSTDGSNDTRAKQPVDAVWRKVSQMKDPNGALLFPYLPVFMVSLVTIPHNSAD